jgi:hypothetical protein
VGTTDRHITEGPDRDLADEDVVIEFRTHGVSGTPPESMLNCSAVIQVWGDQTGRFFRPADTLGAERWRVADVQTADGPAVARYREGYHWGKMTSGGLRQALWALLVPFAIVNLSQWMVPPSVAGSAGRRAVTVLRALVRVVGLGLTLVLMVQLSVVVADMLAVQCFHASQCLQTWTLIQWLRDSPWCTASFVLLVLAVPVFVGAQITAQSRNALLPDQKNEKDGRRKGLRDDGTAGTDTASPNNPKDPVDVPKVGPDPNIAAPDFYERGSAVPARTLHGAVALTGVALLLSGGWEPLPGGVAKITWVVSAVLIALGVVCAVLLDDPKSSGGRFHGGRRVITVLGGETRYRAIWWGLAALNLIVAGLFSFRPMLVAAPSPQWRTNVDALVEWLFVGLAALCAAAFVAACLAALGSRRTYPLSVPSVYRPWLGGITTAVLLPLSALLGAGLGTGLAQTLQNCLTTGCKPRLFVESGGDPHTIVMPKAYDAIALMWGITALVALGLAIVVGISSFWCAKASGRFAAPRLMQGRSMAVAWFMAGIKVNAARILLVLVAVAVTAGVVSALAVNTLFSASVRSTWWLDAVFRNTGLLWVADRFTSDRGAAISSTLQGIGLLALAAIVIGLLYAIYNAYRKPDSAGRSLGVLWDLASFWPTESHPLVPPCYARKAIDDITTRVRCYRACYPRARIVLCGHSQGSLLMYATVLRLAILDLANHGAESPILAKVGLVTHGSQLQWAYGRAFPDMLSYFSHRTAMAALGGRWHNLVRFTDPLGGPVLSWGLEVNGDRITGEWLPGTPETPNTFARTDSGARVIGHERWLPDPVRNEPIFPARKHSDYTLDPQWDVVVALAAGLQPAADTAPPAGVEAQDPR